MLTKKEIESLNYFNKESDVLFYDNDYCIEHDGKGWVFSEYDEVTGETFPIKRLTSLEDLKNTYLLLTNHLLE